MSRRLALAATVVQVQDEAITFCADARPRAGAYGTVGVVEDLDGHRRDLIERVDG